MTKYLSYKNISPYNFCSSSWSTIIINTFCIFLFIAFISYYCLWIFHLPGIGDFNIYIAAIHSLYENFLDPTHEAMSIDGKYSLVYNPLIVATAEIGRVFQLNEYSALQLVGVFNVTFYVLSIIIYFRITSLTPRTFLPATLFLAISLFIRNENYGWSSETSFLTMKNIQAYPSLLAWSLALLAFATIEQLYTYKRLIYVSITIILLYLLILIHTITASWVIGILGVRLLYEILKLGNKKSSSSVYLIFVYILSIILAFELALLWPYGDLLGLWKQSNVNENAPFGAGWAPITSMGCLYMLAIPSFFLLRSEKRGELLFYGFLATGSALILFKAIHLQYGDRYVFFMAFFAQVAVTEVTSIGLIKLTRITMIIDERSLIKLRISTPWLTITAFTLLILFWFIGSSALKNRSEINPLWHQRNPANTYYSKIPELRQVLKHGNIVLIPSTDSLSYVMRVLTGAASVIVPFGFGAPDFDTRINDVNDFFTSNISTTKRYEIIHRYNVSHILLTSDSLYLQDKFKILFGSPIVDTPNMKLFHSTLLNAISISGQRNKVK